VAAAAPAATVGARGRLRLGRHAGELAPAAVAFAIGIGGWEALVRLFDVKKIILPPPSAIARTLWDQKSPLFDAGLYTFTEALGGFVAGSLLAILAAVVLGRFRGVSAAVMPFAIAANAVPIIAFAPITNQWFGPLEKTSKMAIAGILVFFPVLTNTLRGLTSVQPAAIELMRSYAAGDVAVFRRVRFPNALPFIFTALKIATVLAMIGAVIGEYFLSSQSALGFVIRNSVALSSTELGWAGIVVASLFGIAFYAVVAAAERLLTGWQAADRAGR
jgi:NitT/TauT family transport system permease protein